MAMVRMTAKEMRERYPLTPERIKELELLSQREPDLSDPDNPELDFPFRMERGSPCGLNLLQGRKQQNEF